MLAYLSAGLHPPGVLSLSNHHDQCCTLPSAQPKFCLGAGGPLLAGKQLNVAVLHDSEGKTVML